MIINETWTMEIRRRSPLIPMTTAATAATAGPTMNRMPIESKANEFPQGINLGCRAINKPIYSHHFM